jgi:hypothetical protein
MFFPNIPGHILSHIMSFLTAACDVCRKTFPVDDLVRDCIAYELENDHRETCASRYDFICAQCVLSQHASPVRFLTPF